MTYQEASAIYDAACAYFDRITDAECSDDEHSKAVEQMVNAWADLRRAGRRARRASSPPAATPTRRSEEEAA